jgi:ubiquitin conjugation factor E4 B
MEAIRRRRVAKLGAAPSQSTPQNAETPENSASFPGEETAKGREDVQSRTPTPNESRPQINITRAAESSDPSPIAQVANTDAESKPRGDTSSELSAGRVGSSRKRPAADIDMAASALASALTAPPARRHATTPRIESIEDYTDNMLGHIFRVTVDSNRTTDSHGHKLVFLPNLSQDLQESQQPLKLTIDVIDSAIVEAASLAPANKPVMDYLLPCWKRVTKAIKVIRSPGPEKESVLREARRICFSNCIFAVTMPELFRYLVCRFFGITQLMPSRAVVTPTQNMTPWFPTSYAASRMRAAYVSSFSKRPSPGGTKTKPSSLYSPRPW